MASLPSGQYTELRSVLIDVAARVASAYESVYVPIGADPHANFEHGDYNRAFAAEMEKLEATDQLVIVQPLRVPSSTLFLAGVAVGRQKPVVMIVPKKGGGEANLDVIPYLMRGAPSLRVLSLASFDAESLASVLLDETARVDVVKSRIGS